MDNEYLTFIIKISQMKKELWGGDKDSSCENVDFDILMELQVQNDNSAILSACIMCQVSCKLFILCIYHLISK